MTNTCARCGKSWESEGSHPAVVHKTTVCAECKGDDIPLVVAPQEQIRAAAGGFVREAGRKSGNDFEGCAVFFNATVPPRMLLFAGPDEDPDNLEIHAREDAYDEHMADDKMREASRRTVRMIRTGMRAKRTRRQARLK